MGKSINKIFIKLLSFYFWVSEKSKALIIGIQVYYFGMKMLQDFIVNNFVF